jgi:hypothetical protein
LGKGEAGNIRPGLLKHLVPPAWKMKCGVEFWEETSSLCLKVFGTGRYLLYSSRFPLCLATALWTLSSSWRWLSYSCRGCCLSYLLTASQSLGIRLSWVFSLLEGAATGVILGVRLVSGLGFLPWMTQTV